MILEPMSMNFDSLMTTTLMMTKDVVYNNKQVTGRLSIKKNYKILGNLTFTDGRSGKKKVNCDVINVMT